MHYRNHEGRLVLKLKVNNDNPHVSNAMIKMSRMTDSEHLQVVSKLPFLPLQTSS